ncbi:type B DNA-directed DNA polymerase [Halomarina oriensis]|uniref:DNA-directed DNA polymerase n=1 Tax=Halomarina oriensis TaxID=671145 RepID=A0A6B0GNI5_9EURY|nr:type B DNA-directed DNA polymerase [Halomarina oriensis]
MVYKIDYRDDCVWEWTLTDDGATVERNPEYTPTLYATTAPPLPDGTPSQVGRLTRLTKRLRNLPHVEAVRTVSKRPGFRYPVQEALAIDVCDLTAVEEVAWFVSRYDRPGRFRLFNVDLHREFRYCLEEDIQPVASRALRTVEIAIPSEQMASGDLQRVVVDGEATTGTDWDILDAVRDRLNERDPDVLAVNTGDVVPALFDVATSHDVPLRLGRAPGYDQLAGKSTYQSYGRVGHSPARYNVPGRVLIDTSNAFFWDESNLDGILDLVERSGKPLQEVGWASIGNVLTAIQIREALSRSVLVPWKAWRPERFKTMRQLHAADRGGTTLSPEVGLHRDVHELDFASLYPNIICTRNLSPETVRCDCHPDRRDLDSLDYAVCPDDGYLPDVLQPIIDDRAAIKRRIAETDDPDERAALEGRSSALKWILVSCFGYQGFANAKFGRIEVHEAINAIARDILLSAKTTLEAGGWEVLHGIVDSLWVTPSAADPTSLDELAAAITADVGIELEYEGAFDWVAFVPQRHAEAGALTKYFGKRTGIDRTEEKAFKFRGIECRQRSTPPFVAAVQRDLIRTLDKHLAAGKPADEAPAAVCDGLRVHLSRLRRGDVPTDALAIDQRMSKARDEYHHETRTVSALARASDYGLPVSSGQSIRYVVVNDERRGRERVRLLEECSSGEYDTEFYADLVIRATASVLSPLGWRKEEVQGCLDSWKNRPLESFRAGLESR